MWILIIFGIAILYLILNKIIETNKGKVYFSEQLCNIDNNLLTKELEDAKNFSINQIQDACIFTTHYIKLMSGRYSGGIFISKNLVKVYHFIYEVKNIAIGIVKKEKSIILEFNDGMKYTMKDEVNQSIVDKHKYHKNYNFDNTVILEIQKLYPWVDIGIDDVDMEMHTKI